MYKNILLLILPLLLLLGCTGGGPEEFIGDWQQLESDVVSVTSIKGDNTIEVSYSGIKKMDGIWKENSEGEITLEIWRLPRVGDKPSWTMSARIDKGELVIQNGENMKRYKRVDP